MKNTLYPNGFIIKEIHEKNQTYIGIEGNCWPLKYLDNRYDYYNDYVSYVFESSILNSEFVDLCNNLKFIKQYQETCKNEGIRTIILYCQTEKTCPIFNNNFLDSKLTFLGYDYASSGGEYYSCVYNDMIRNIPEFKHLKTNKYGLFTTEGELNEFIVTRNYAKSLYDNLMFEKGEYIIYKIWLVKL